MSTLGSDPEDRDELDARFRSIIDAEFGDAGSTATPVPEPSRRPAHEDFNLARALDEVTPDAPDEPFVPPEPEPLDMPTGRVLLGCLLVIASLVVVMAGLFGVDLPAHLGQVAVACFVGGLAILLFSLPKGERDPWDDGTRV